MDRPLLLAVDRSSPRHAGPASATEALDQVATLVECAASARWSRFAEVALDLTGAMAVDVDDAQEALGGSDPGVAPPPGRRVMTSLHPLPGIEVTLTFASEEARTAAGPVLRALGRILGATRRSLDAPHAARTAPPLADAIAALPLSPRMREVARLVVAGRSDKEIADELGVSHASARSYVQRMCRNLGVSGRGGVLRTVLGDPSGARRRRKA